ncbi:MAG: tetratricopeptide repeat protein [bacterium]
MESKNVRPHILICLILVIAVLTVYWQVRNYEFINLDDNTYVTENQHVTRGLTLKNIVWAFRTTHAANWHPTTWLSHMADCQLYGLDSGRHHLTNVLIHIFNSLLLFSIFLKITKDFWQCSVIAALFALHPLHVESVAWVAERKDVLSTFFLMLTIWMYVMYIENKRITPYLFMILCFILGLMAKPMLVTLPFVLLLLDYWPLKRTSIYPLVSEKIPLLMLAGASSILTLWVQQSGGAVRSLGIYPVTMRIANAFVSYITYMGKMVFPYHLAVLYPYPLMFPAWKVAGACIVLLSITLCALLTMRKYPYFLIGWLWYIGTCVPVIGLVQVGSQAMADRYTYIPLIGLFIIIAWGVPALFSSWHYKKKALAAVTSILFIALMIITYQQVGYWSTSITLFQHAIESTTHNYLAHHNLGVALADQGNLEKAIEHYSEALRIHPDFALAHSNLGSALRMQGQISEAIKHYNKALEIEPDHVFSHYNLGIALKEQGRIAEATEHYFEALRLRPDFVLAHNNLGNALLLQGKTSEAIEHYSEALRIDPCNALSHFNMGTVLARQGNTKKAIAHFQKALQIKPDYKEAYHNLKMILTKNLL